MKASEMKRAFGHLIYYLATFEFGAIDYKQQGEYTCVYGVNISSYSYLSGPSKPLQVTVVGMTQKRFHFCFYSFYLVILDNFLLC